MDNPEIYVSFNKHPNKFPCLSKATPLSPVLKAKFAVSASRARSQRLTVRNWK